MAQPQQGKAVEMMPLPQVSVACPPGLEYLTQIDQLLVHQQIELLEVLTGWEQANTYLVKNSLGQQVYVAQEKSDCCSRQCCGPIRAFRMSIVNNLGEEVMSMDRPLRCGTECCCENARPFMEVQAPIGTTIGFVKSEGCALFHPSFLVMDPEMTPIFRIKTPVCGKGCCWNVEPKYPIETMDGSEVGIIQKQWSGFLKEFLTDADNFGITFPMDLEVKLKATLFGALFLIDYLFFETKQNQNQGGG